MGADGEGQRIGWADQRLSDKDIATFERDGVVVVRGMYQQRAAQLQQWASEMAEWPEVPGRYAMYFESSSRAPGSRILNRIEQFIEYHDGFRQLLSDASIMCRLAQLLGEPAVLFKEKINYKLPGGGAFEPHQDIQAGWEAFSRYYISVLVSIDANTLENGCVEFAAGHHTRGVIGEQWKPLAGRQLNNMVFTPLPMEPGDAVFFDCFVPHRSARNMTDSFRRNLYVTYNRARDGDFRGQYFREKRMSFPPDIERKPGERYIYRV